jgi:PEP-CTERM motif-containing protein/dockerin type I repeat protein
MKFCSTVMLLLLGYAVDCAADTITLGPLSTTTPISMTPADWSAGLAFPKFDPSLGTLSNVVFQLTANFNSQVSAQNNSDTESSNGSASLQVKMTTDIEYHYKMSFMYTGGSFSYFNLAPHGTYTKNDAFRFSDPVNFGGFLDYRAFDYIGTGNFVLPVTTSVVSFYPWSSLDDTITYSVSADLTGTVTYTYQKITVGDFTRDGVVSAADMPQMIAALANSSAYETSKVLTDGQLLAIGDVNHDGAFTNADLQKLLIILKNGGGSTDPVPEPSTFALLSLGAVGFLFRRRFVVC